MAVYLCLGSQKNFKSWLIRTLTRGPYSHSWIEYDSVTWGSHMIVHAQSEGVVIEHPETVSEEYQIHKRYRFDHPGAQEGLRQCYQYIGKPYDYKVILTHALLLILYYMVPIQKFRDWLWTKTVTNSRAYSCTELVVLLMKWAGYKNALSLKEDLVSPTDLNVFFSKNTEFIPEEI